LKASVLIRDQNRGSRLPRRFHHLRSALIVLALVSDFEIQVRGRSLTEPGGEYG